MANTETIKITMALNFPCTLRSQIHQVKRRLENLENVQIVTVEKNSTLSHGACEWTVTFDTELGDLPMLEITSGRLTGNQRTKASVGVRT